MSDNNPIGYDDLFNFGDKSEVQKGIDGIAELKKAYSEFYQVVTKGQLNRLTQQEKDLSKVKRELAEATKALSIAEKSHQQQLINNLKLSDQNRIAEESLKKAREETKKANENLKNGVNSLAKEYSNLKKEYEKAFKSGDTDAMKKISTQARELDSTIKNVNANLRASKPAFKAAAGSYAELDYITKELVKDLKNIPGGMKATSKEAQFLKKVIYENTEQLKKFDAEMNHNFRNVGNYKSALNGLGDSLGNLLLGYLSIQGVIMGVTATFDQSLRSDAVRQSLKFTFESADLADAKLEQLLATANRLGIDYNALADSYKSFIGAVVASNYDFEQGERIFNAVAGASARLKLSSEDTEGALRALQQMISKGNVQAEELRGQLGERIPGAFSIAARAMNVTEAELNKMLEKGEVLAADLLPKLATELEKTFDTNATERVEGLSAAWERLTNVFSGTVAESGRITKFFTAIIDGVGEAAKSIANMVNSNSWQEFWARLLVNDNGKTGDAIRSISDSFEKASKVINTAMETNAGSSNKKIITSYQEVKIAYENATNALAQYQDAIKRGTLKDGGKIQLSELKNSIDFLYTQKERLAKLLPKQVAPVKIKTQAELDAESRKAEVAENKRKAAAEKARKNADDLAKANAKLLISEAELEFSKGQQGVDDKIAFENKKLEILNNSYSQRLKLYNKDSDEYKNILSEKNNSEINGIEQIAKAREDDVKKKQKEAEDELKYQKALADGRAKVFQAEKDKERSQAEGKVQLDVAKGILTPGQGNDKLYQIRKADLEREVEDRKSALEAFNENDLEYFDAKEALLNAEKDLIDDKTNYEISKAEEVNERRKELAQEILDYTNNIAQAAFEFASAFTDRNLQKLEEQRDLDLKAAGDNAQAKERIEADYNKRVSAEKRKQAIADKEAAVIGIAINTASAILKVTAQTGVLAPFIIPSIIALGAIQTGVVLAKPIPKFAVGTQNAPEGPAIVGEQGREAIEENGKVRFSGPKAELTYLKKGAKVLTAKQTRDKYDYDLIEDKRFGDDVVEGLIRGTGIVTEANHLAQTKILGELLGKALTPEQIEEAMAKAVANMPFNQTNFDKDGISDFFISKGSKIGSQNTRNTLGGNG